METRNSFTFELSEAQQAALIQTLREGNYRPAAVPYARAAADGDHCRIVLYTSGKLVVQGKGAQDFVTFVLEPQILQAAELGYETVLHPEAVAPHIGVDESGKGDFFGPLVIASAYTDEALSRTMQEMGVRDSKRISSDARALELARDIRKLLGNRFSVIAIGPAKYNQLYARMRSVNTLLAWGHARAIENLLGTVPGCRRAVSDQFGSKEQVKRALMQKGRSIELVQRHRAESDIAVAAASILAREGFLMGLRRLGETHGVATLPKGASSLVQEAAVDLVRKHAPGILLETAKCHFKTADDVLSRLHLDRGALGPDGAVTSRPPRPGGFRRPHAHENGES